MVGKKKRGHPDVEELLARPWCYYCERDFDDLKILISHQKAKHFKCERCGRRLNTAGGLSVHMNQVHKETLTTVDNSLPNRQGLEVEIFGMEGIPEDVAQAHNQRIIAGFYQAEAERRAATGNPGPGGQQGGQTKKPKFEAPSDLKKRLAEHKARKAEQAAAGIGSGGNTPMDGANNSGSPMGQSPGAFSGSPYAPPQASYNGTPGTGYGSFSQEQYAPPVPAYQQPPGPSGAQYQPQYSPPQQYNPQQSLPPAGYSGQSFSALTPAASYNGYQAPPSHTPPAPGSLPSRPPSLPPAPGLPQRPSFAPSILPYQMQQMHQPQPQQGGWTGNGWNGQNQNAAMSSVYPPQGYGGHSTNAPGDDQSGLTREVDDIDELIRMAEAGIKPPKKGEAPASAVLGPPPGLPQLPLPAALAAPAPPTVEPIAKTEVVERKAKKEMKMVYNDNEISPEEKMSLLPRYAFAFNGETESSGKTTQASAAVEA